MSQASKISDNEERYRYQRGMEAFNKGDYGTAADILESIAQATSMSSVLSRFYAGRARYHLGLSDFKAGQYEAAAQQFIRARRHNPQADGLTRFLARCYLGMRDYDRAADTYSAILKDDPTSEDARIHGALAHWQAGRFDDAIRLLRHGIQTSPAEPELHYQLGLMFAARDNYDKAIAQLTTADALRPNHCETLVKLAWCHAARNDLLKALDCFQRVFELRPYDPEIAMQLTMAARAVQQIHPDLPVQVPEPTHWSKQDADAISELARFVTDDPDFVEAMLSLEHSDIDADIFRVLAGTLEAALRRTPEHADLHYHAARVYERLGDADQAIRASQRAVKLNPRFTQALIHLARLYATTNRNQDAIERLEASIEAGADYPDVHYMLGNLYRDTGQAQQARKEYCRAIDLNADYQAAHAALAVLAQ